MPEIIKKADNPANPDYKGFVDGTNIGIPEARMNKPPIASNTSGYNGVYPSANGMRTAQITFKNKTYYWGSFSDIQDAVLARKQGEEMFENFLEWYYATYPKKEHEARQV